MAMYQVTVNGIDYNVDADFESGDDDVGMPAGYVINSVQIEGEPKTLDDYADIEDDIVSALFDADEPDYEPEDE